MPEKKTLKAAQKDKREGKAPSTQAGEFVREEMDHIREGKHGARSTRQAIAIGLSKARRAGVHLAQPRNASAATKASVKSAERREGKPVSAKRSRASSGALKREGHTAASLMSLSRQAKGAAKKRTAASRSKAAKKAARTRARER